MQKELIFRGKSYTILNKKEEKQQNMRVITLILDKNKEEKPSKNRETIDMDKTNFTSKWKEDILSLQGILEENSKNTFKLDEQIIVNTNLKTKKVYKLVLTIP